MLKLQYSEHLMQSADSLGKDPDAGKNWRQEGQGMTEDEMVAWHHRLNAHGLAQTAGDGKGREAWSAAVHGVADSLTQLHNWKTTIFFWAVRFNRGLQIFSKPCCKQMWHLLGFVVLFISVREHQQSKLSIILMGPGLWGMVHEQWNVAFPFLSSHTAPSCPVCHHIQVTGMNDSSFFSVFNSLLYTFLPLDIFELFSFFNWDIEDLILSFLNNTTIFPT